MDGPHYGMHQVCPVMDSDSVLEDTDYASDSESETEELQDEETTLQDSSDNSSASSAPKETQDVIPQMSIWSGSSLYRTLQVRIGNWLFSKEFSDCCFIFPNEDGKELYAHRIILAAATPVFCSMLSNEWQGNERKIEITDVDYSTFSDFLRFIYTDEMKITSSVHAANLLYLFKKYLMDEPTDICRKYIQRNINMDNAVIMYAVCNENIDEPVLCKDIVKYLCSYPIIIKKYARHIDIPLMKAIVNSDAINCTEVELISTVRKWLVYRFHNPTPEQCQQILIDNGIIQKLRFLALRQFDPSNRVVRYMLSLDQIKQIEKDREKDDISSEQREERKHLKCLFKRSRRHIVECAPYLYVRDTPSKTVSIVCDKSIILCGFILLARNIDWDNYTPTYEEDMNWTITSSKGKLMAQGRILDHAYCGSQNEYFLNQYIVLKKGIKYTFEFTTAPHKTSDDIIFRPDIVCNETNSSVKIKYFEFTYYSILLGLTYYL